MPTTKETMALRENPPVTPGIRPMSKTKAIELLRAVVKERGKDFVYYAKDFGRTYSYEFEGHGACGVGLAFEKWDKDVFDAVTWHEKAYGTCSVNNVNAHGLIAPMTHAAAQILREFQERQDAHFTYGEALKSALAVAKTL